MSRRIFKQAGEGISSVRFPDVAAPARAAQAGPAEEARVLVAKAAAEAGLIRAAALEEGRAAAVKIYEEPLLAALAAIAAAKAALENAASAAAAGAEKEMVRLVMCVAEKIIRRKLDSDSDEVFLMISRAVQAVPKGKTLLIKVNEKDYLIANTY